MNTIRQQIHNNAVALISICIAVSTLAYNTWRNETTEEQRNVRHAAFRVIEELSEAIKQTRMAVLGVLNELD
jgi:hypothetical protein